MSLGFRFGFVFAGLGMFFVLSLSTTEFRLFTYGGLKPRRQTRRIKPSPALILIYTLNAAPPPPAPESQKRQTSGELVAGAFGVVAPEPWSQKAAAAFVAVGFMV